MLCSLNIFAEFNFDIFDEISFWIELLFFFFWPAVAVVWCFLHIISSDARDVGVNAMPADALAPKVARASAGMVLAV